MVRSTLGILTVALAVAVPVAWSGSEGEAVAETETETETPIAPGSDRLDPGVIEPFAARYAMTRGGEPWAKADIQLWSSAVAGQPAWRHGFSMHFTGQTVYDETLLLRESLAPVMKFIHGGLPPDVAYKVYTYQPDALRGSNVYADGRDPEPIAQLLERPAFGAGTDGLVLAALPLGEGFAATVESADDSGIHPNRVRVEGRESVTAAGKTWDTWVVSVRDGQGKQWISRKAPYLIKMEFPAAGIAWTLDRVMRSGDW